MADDEGRQAEVLHAAAAPALSRVMFLFNQPPGMSSEEMRRKAWRVLGAGAALMAFVYWLTPRLMASKIPGGEVLLPVLIIVYGLGFLLVPAAMFRILFGVTRPGGGMGFLRGLVGLVLFFVTAIGSCLLYGQINP